MKIDYGKKGLEIKLDPKWNVTILHPKVQKTFENPIGEIKRVIKNPVGSLPLKEIVKSKKILKTVCIVANDATRPVPSSLILEVLIDELGKYGIKDNQIKILIATGLHRASRDEELERILGKNLKMRLKTIDHIATDRKSLFNLGITKDKNPIFINKHYCEADLKILTGYVEPHFFFGFSGGRKSIIPGIAGIKTIQANHSAENIASPYSRFGIYKENLLHKNAMEITKRVGVDFIINVCINELHEIVEIVAGDIEKVHEKLVDYQLKHIFREINKPCDIIICGNGGYPLDLIYIKLLRVWL